MPAQLQLVELHVGFVANRALLAAVELGVADLVPLQGELQTARQLAERLGAKDHELVYRFMRHLSSIHVFKEYSARRFGHTDLSLLLRHDHPQSMRACILCFGQAQYRGWDGLAHMLRTGETSFDHVNGGTDLWSYYGAHKQEEESFQQMLVQTLSAATPPITMDFRWAPLVAQVRREKQAEGILIADIGGGTGTVLRLILEELASEPNVRGLLFDQESVIEQAQGKWANDPFRNKTAFISGSFFGWIPEADIFVLRMVLHDWDDSKASNILRNVRDAMPPHSRVVVIENVMPSEGKHSGLVPLSAEAQDMHMMVMLNGKERTVDEFQYLFASATLQLVKSTPTRGIYHILEAKLQ